MLKKGAQINRIYEAKNGRQSTVLDIATLFLKEYRESDKKNKTELDAYIKLVDLLRKHGAKTAKELKTVSMP